MNHFFQKRLLLSIFVALLALCPLQAQETEDFPGKLQRELEDVLSDESLDPVKQLTAQTAILVKAIQEGLSLDEDAWSRIDALLSAWEQSSDLRLARDSYLQLIASVARQREGQAEAFPFEESMRGYLQKALTLARSRKEEGLYLFFLADSWIRSAPENNSILRRAESLLLQAAMAMGPERPKDALRFRLGQLYEKWGKAPGSNAVDQDDQTFLTRAVENYRAIARLPDARESFRAVAEASLSKLLEPELSLKIENRFLPQNDIRLSVRTRNVDAVNVRVLGLPADAETVSYSLAEIRSRLRAQDPANASFQMSESFPIRGRYPHDWREREIRLSQTLPAGWYGVFAEGKNVEKYELLLVTSLEVAILPRKDGAMLVWVADAESGLPAVAANVSVLDASGNELSNGVTDKDGLLNLNPDQVDGWFELHVQSNQVPGHLRREDIPRVAPSVPWLVSNPVEVAPGDSLYWSLLANDHPLPESLTFILPDGTEVQAEPEKTGSGWASGSLAIGDAFEFPGPIFARLGENKELSAGFLRNRPASPLSLSFNGERIDPSLNLFLAGTPVDIQISAAFGMESEIPDFIRLRVRRLERDPLNFRAPGEPSDEEVVYEAILPFDEIDQGGIFVELSDVPVEERILPLEIQVLPLEGTTPITARVIGLTPFRNVVEVSIRDRIIRPGESAKISLMRSEAAASASRVVEGELVVYRETWENRYIHRRRGTPLSESEYLALPDRSLLGVAKTDYRLSEQGYVREEVRRIPVEAGLQPSEIEISLDRPGYYNMEFDGRELNSRGFYPEGPLEVWVVAEEGEMRGLRSEKPRLIFEESEAGQQEILVLLDRSEGFLLLDLEFEDGSTRTLVDQPSRAAYFKVFQDTPGAALSACRILVVGDRRTDLLLASGHRRSETEWSLNEDNFFGLNPGVAFDWDLSTSNPALKKPILWTFFPEGYSSLTTPRMRWQDKLQEADVHHEDLRVAYLGKWLPLFHPFLEQTPPTGETSHGFTQRLVSPAVFEALYPEARRFTGPLQSGTGFDDVGQPDDNGKFSVSGVFPNDSGRWLFTLLGPSGHHDLQSKSWLISTELPIRTVIDGLTAMRVGDRAGIPLVIENTTREQTSLDLTVSVNERLRLNAPGSQPISLSPVSREENLLEIDAIDAGEGRIDVLVRGPESSSEALHEIDVIGGLPENTFAFLVSGPGEAVVEKQLQITGWNSAELVVSAGLAEVLPELWPFLKQAELGPEPLMAALGDWALASVGARHGLSWPNGDVNSLEAVLRDRLDEFQTSSGGWSWLRDEDPDPWLSAFIMWSLEIFSGGQTNLLSDNRMIGRSYLESILIDDDLSLESRLFALRALAVPAFHNSRIRPSRIQARSFLDFLHRRETLSGTEIGFLLQVAKAYQFSQEVQLLATSLRERIQTRGPDATDFWTGSLHYLALSETRSGDGTEWQYLESALNALGRQGPSRSWQQVGGFLNLLAAYYWGGDFNVEGSVSVKLGSSETSTLILSPDPDRKRLMRYSLSVAELEAGTFPVKMDMKSAESPVVVIAKGMTDKTGTSVVFPNARIEFYREFFEETLLKGTRNQIRQLGDTLEPLEIGDIIRAVVTVEVPERRAYAEFNYCVPAGFSLESGGIEHIWEPKEDFSEIGSESLLARLEPSQPLCRTVRTDNLPAGRHQFTVSYEVKWPGTFIWPSFQLLIPRTGENRILSEVKTVIVNPADR